MGEKQQAHLGFHASRVTRHASPLLIVLLAACAIPAIPSRIVYEDPVNFVRLETDASVLAELPETLYSHPARVSVLEMTEILDGLLKQDRHNFLQVLVFGEPPPEAVFRPAEIALLAPKLTDALAQARADERVAFYLSRPQTSIKREITTGGLYVRGHELRVIVGNHRVIYGIPAYGLVYDRRYPTMPTAPKIFALAFAQPGVVVPQEPGLVSRLLGTASDELVIDLNKLRSRRAVAERSRPVVPDS
jgi:hypothetical protein